MRFNFKINVFTKLRDPTKKVSEIYSIFHHEGLIFGTWLCLSSAISKKSLQLFVNMSKIDLTTKRTYYQNLEI